MRTSLAPSLSIPRGGDIRLREVVRGLRAEARGDSPLVECAHGTVRVVTANPCVWFAQAKTCGDPGTKVGPVPTR